MQARGYVGKTADGDKLWLEIELREEDARGRFRSAVDHEPVGIHTELSITGSGLDARHHAPARDIQFGGQCIDTLRAVVKPETGWTVEELHDLAELWERWHLNGMRAGCVHQTPWMVEDKYGRAVPSLTLTRRCAESGYRYGHAWLIEPIPGEVIERVRAYADRLDGSDPVAERYR